ncbi:MAG: hypothetical protein GX417_04725 [Clostridiales bacterium]|nr:hypothetical protein [Clostridiales bacterium]
MNEAHLSLVTPETAAEYAGMLAKDDIPALIERLASSEDKVRYPAFLLLRARSAAAPDVCPHWDALAEKLQSENSYQRSIGAMLLSANARWDDDGRMRRDLPHLLELLNDEKPITVRQCIQSLPDILSAQPALADEIAAALLRIDLMQIRESMRKLILSDLLEALIAVRSIAPEPAVDAYLFSALSGSILDEKTKKRLHARL